MWLFMTCHVIFEEDWGKIKLNEPGRQTVDWWDCCGCSVPFYKQIVPTVDTVRYQFLMTTLIENHIPIMLVGPVGTGKTSVAENSLGCQDPKEYTILVINMSARVSQQGASCLSAQAVSQDYYGGLCLQNYYRYCALGVFFALICTAFESVLFCCFCKKFFYILYHSHCLWPPERRLGISDGSPPSGISGLSFDSTFLSPFLFFCLVFFLFLSCHFLNCVCPSLICTFSLIWYR